MPTNDKMVIGLDRVSKAVVAHARSTGIRNAPSARPTVGACRQVRHPSQSRNTPPPSASAGRAVCSDCATPCTP
ncbi:hypothetical protein GALL_473740 [mine drainage metagenome]|uniref:Uncharacterized protein n=1 Tax=mine drainage metagenome TaxID=410659 RepID=A0A1J5PHC7_9ZZZZ